MVITLHCFIFSKVSQYFSLPRSTHEMGMAFLSATLQQGEVPSHLGWFSTDTLSVQEQYVLSEVWAVLGVLWCTDHM